MTPEGKIKAAFNRACKRHDVLSFQQAINSESLRGVVVSLELLRLRGIPDKALFLRGGKTIFVEFKREKGGVVSPFQKIIMCLLDQLGFGVYMVDSKRDIDALMRWIERV